MKKNYLFMLFLVAFCLNFNVIGQTDFLIPLTTDSIIVDGVADEITWSNDLSVVGKFETNPYTSLASQVEPSSMFDFSGTLKAAYTSEGLYVLYDVLDDVIDDEKEADESWFETDRIETYLLIGDGSSAPAEKTNVHDGDEFGAYQIAWRFEEDELSTPGEYHTSWENPILYAKKETNEGDGYIVELMIPWSSLGVAAEDITEGYTFYMDATVTDIDGNNLIEGASNEMHRKYVKSGAVLYNWPWFQDDRNPGLAELSGIISDIENSSIATVNMFPSPAQGIVNLENITADRVVVYSILGVEVLNTKLNSENQFDVQGLQSGLYIVNVLNNNKIIGNNKLMVK